MSGKTNRCTIDWKFNRPNGFSCYYPYKNCKFHTAEYYLNMCKHENGRGCQCKEARQEALQTAISGAMARLEKLG